MRRFIPLALLAAVAAQAQPLELVQRVGPFIVRDASGQAYAYPFAGGFGSAAGYLAPKPQLVDVDGDGDPDLVVNEGGRGLMYYENVGEGGPGFGFRWRTDALGGVAPGAWSQMGDLDGDGDPDLLTQGGPTLLRYWRNDGPGTGGLPTFTLLGDPLPAASGGNVTTEDQSVPALVDADADGDLDFIHGQVDRGNLTLWRHDGLDGDGRPRFTFVTSQYEGIEVYEPNPTCDDPAGPGMLDLSPGGRGFGSRPSARHGANALTFADVDGDGLRDFFWGDFYTRSLWYFDNAGTPSDPDFQIVSEIFPLDEPLTSGGYNVATFGDVDRDGDLDLVFGILGGLCATSQNWFDALFFYENVGAPTAPSYTLRSPQFIRSVDVGRTSVPALTDLDGDGDLDLVLANSADPANPSTANLALFTNEGTATAPSLRLTDPDWLALRYDFGAYGPTFGDLDADSDPDLLVGGLNGRLAFLRNTGSATAPQFTQESDRFQDVDVSQFMRPSLGDLDGDGDLDLMTGEANGRVRVYRNAGTPQEPSFPNDGGLPTPDDVAWRAAIGLPEDAGDFSAPSLADADGDGDLDLYVGTEAGPVRFFRNGGSATAPLFAEETAIGVYRRTTTPAAADVDGDGDVDLMAGTGGGGLVYFDNTTFSIPTAPDPGPRGEVRLDTFPNPFRSGVTFRLRGLPPDARRLAIVVHDLLGREVQRLPVPAGADEVAWEGSSAAPGRYTARLLADGRTLATASLTRLQ